MGNSQNLVDNGVRLVVRQAALLLETVNGVTGGADVLLVFLLVALLGLIGFIRDESLRRSKEMAVRKINGASAKDILRIFASDILKLSLVMAALACAGSFFVARRMLELFAEKVSLNPFYFLAGTLEVLLIILIVVVLNTWRISTSNPVDSLKNE